VRQRRPDRGGVAEDAGVTPCHTVARRSRDIYTPFLQQAFSTVSLTAGDWARCLAVGSSVLWLSELGKLIARRRHRDEDGRDRSSAAEPDQARR
jgi:hypothetical protein